MHATTPIEPVENTTLFRYVLFHRDDERKLYAADELDHIRYFASWLADDLYLDLIRTSDGEPVRGVWEFGPLVAPEYAELMRQAPTVEKIAALKFEQQRLDAQIVRSRRAGF